MRKFGAGFENLTAKNRFALQALRGLKMRLEGSYDAVPRAFPFGKAFAVLCGICRQDYDRARERLGEEEMPRASFVRHFSFYGKKNNYGSGVYRLNRHADA